MTKAVSVTLELNLLKKLKEIFKGRYRVVFKIETLSTSECLPPTSPHPNFSHQSTKHWLLFHWAKYCYKCQTLQGSLRLQSRSPQKHILSEHNPKPFRSNLIYKRNEHILKSECGDFFLLDPKGVAFICYERKFPRFVAHNSA